MTIEPRVLGQQRAADYICRSVREIKRLSEPKSEKGRAGAYRSLGRIDTPGYALESSVTDV